MSTLLFPLNVHMQEIADEHAGWLRSYDARYLKKWIDLFKADMEAAMGEAAVRRRLQHYGVSVEPNEDLNTGKAAPDFRCIRSGHEFFVEVACITIAAAEEKTGIPNVIPHEGGFGLLNLAIFQKCVKKARQASSVDAHVLVAIGTWHSWAAMQFRDKPMLNMLLTGEQMISWRFNVNTGEQSKTYLSTNLYPAIFLKPDEENQPGAARESICGVLLCAFGMPGIEPVVVLNPNACRPFDTMALPELEYGSVSCDRSQNCLSVNWENHACAQENGKQLDNPAKSL